ncbi:hypothetical protein PAMP_003489 [Pampus punctatissimus]
MTACTFNILIIFTIYLCFVLFLSHGFEVIQPQNRTINPDKSAMISCEHTAEVSSVEDVRLNSISRTGRSMLCQKGMKECKNIVMYPVNASKYLFIILNVEEEAMNMLYECEFTLKKDDLDYTKKGNLTKLLSGQTESKEVNMYDPHPAPPAQPHLFSWIMTALLALMFTYSCVITLFYTRLMNRSRDPENSLYVVMRNGPLPRNPDHGLKYVV